MPAASQPSKDTSAILERIDGIREDIGELKSSITTLADGYSCFKVDYTKAHEELRSDVKQVSERVNEHDKTLVKHGDQLKSHEEKLAPLTLQSRIVAWVGSAIGLMVLYLLWDIFIHRGVPIIP
jgi:septal ring factor EnvC (AmiA/AmiB activator)